MGRWTAGALQNFSSHRTAGIDPPSLMYNGLIFHSCSIARSTALKYSLSGLPNQYSDALWMSI
jgi:hypothetical protein